MLDDEERFQALVFLRRYVTHCARRKRYQQMEGAARLFRTLWAYDGDVLRREGRLNLAIRSSNAER